MTRDPPLRSRSRFAGFALLFAWLLFLGTLGAGAGYVLTLSEQPETVARGPAVAVRLPETEAAATTPAEAEPPEAAPAETKPAETKPAETLPPPPPPAPATGQAAKSEPPPPPPAATEAPTQAAPAPEATQEAALPKPAPPRALEPWERNRQPFDADEARPRIAVVVTGLGLSSSATEAAIRQLPPAVTLSFTPYSRRLNEWIALARVNGHEVMIDLPMEPTSYPDDDPGPLALLTALSPAQNLERLQWALGRATGYVGVAAVMGSRFTASASHVEPILAEIKDRGLMFLDNRASEDSVAGAIAAKMGLPSAVNDRDLDRAQASRVAIDSRLVQVETVARTQGAAVAIARAYPVTIERLRVWAGELEGRGLVLAPITAVAGRQPSQEAHARNARGE